MGDYTEFSGELKLDRPVDAETRRILEGLHETRRMARRVDETKYGIEGEFYFDPDDSGMYDPIVIDRNRPPSSQPSLWCHWKLRDDSTLVCEEGKAYFYVEWIRYIIERVLKPRGYTLNGSVEWTAEDLEDCGRLVVTNNDLKVLRPRIVWEESK